MPRDKFCLGIRCACGQGLWGLNTRSQIARDLSMILLWSELWLLGLA